MFFVLVSQYSFVSFAGEITVAVASNFMLPAKAIAEEFEKSTGHSVRLVFGSSGKIYAQIINGAPFDVFLSADQEKPTALIQSGKGVVNSQFTYASGKLVLWAPSKEKIETMSDAGISAAIENGSQDVQSNLLEQALINGYYQHLAMANPKLAPYGRAAQEVLEALFNKNKTTVNQKVVDKSKIVQGENIAQTFQFVSTGNAELGFVALSQVMKNNNIESGIAWVIPENLYSPVHQDAVLVIKSKEKDVANQFLVHLRNKKTEKIITSFGYSIPKIATKK